MRARLVLYEMIYRALRGAVRVFWMPKTIADEMWDYCARRADEDARATAPETRRERS